MIEIIDKLYDKQTLKKDEFIYLINNRNEETDEYLFNLARKRREEYYGKDVYIRGLIEFTNYCKNDCYYCGIRCSNKNADRYRLTKEEILLCAKEGYNLGFRTIVLQGGEDPYFTDEKMVDIISTLRKSYPDCAITLSIGEKSYDSYKKYYDAGANRFLLRHETADSNHYSKLHPASLSLENRKKCLYDLKDIGYQVGTGFMVGSPYQSAENLADDLLFIKELNPEMVGIGPFIAHKDTPFKDKKNGSFELTLFLLGIIRLMIPTVLLPATTSLATIDKMGREKGILAGANVVMPNLSPMNVRKKYMLYDGKVSTGDEAAESLNHLKESMKKIGYEVVVDRGDNVRERGSFVQSHKRTQKGFTFKRH
ncbi:[FeFe] hydrogenase H-cluster radical SAM maturase HydE [Anaerofustis stercorihominis]|uniref:[FeFe] hydrogenase H-cluster radical SAM maturase HydE n=1 Tax=Anaerofustis stercorihominis TaxID=214853 RepID=UPI00214B6DB0|nr:[FeFe] hydrogenase H-cluster radical SAM maturase HydE [Anaerofustis stercorihominis]MCR2033340.1 [FeFe] hydrogenase H-cluster radical SAM maturase HydE [Anaerofustis stercorihominis]